MSPFRDRLFLPGRDSSPQNCVMWIMLADLQGYITPYFYFLKAHFLESKLVIVRCQFSRRSKHYTSIFHWQVPTYQEYLTSFHQNELKHVFLYKLRSNLFFFLHYSILPTVFYFLTIEISKEIIHQSNLYVFFCIS